MKKVLVSLMMLGSLMATNLYATERPEGMKNNQVDRNPIVVIIVDIIIDSIFADELH